MTELGFESKNESHRHQTVPMNLLKVCVDATGNGDFQGRFYSKLSTEELFFTDSATFLLHADKLFDLCGYPQTFQERRSFHQEKHRGMISRRPLSRMQDEEIIAQKGKCFTFEVIVETRRRSGWQGYLMTEQGGRFHYQSEMELLHLMNCIILARDSYAKENSSAMEG